MVIDAWNPRIFRETPITETFQLSTDDVKRTILHSILTLLDFDKMQQLLMKKPNVIVREKLLTRECRGVQEATKIKRIRQKYIANDY